MSQKKKEIKANWDTPVLQITAWFSSFSHGLQTFPRGSPAPLRSVAVMEWTALISFRSLQRSIVLVCNCIHLKIVDACSFLQYIDATEALKYFYLTVVHKKKKE